MNQTFDEAGNMTRTHTGTELNWNIAAGRLNSADPDGASGGGAPHQYGYDATGRRAWKELNDGCKPGATRVIDN